MIAAYLVAAASSAFGADDPMVKLVDGPLQFLRPAGGKIVSVEGNVLTLEMDSSDSIRPGTRLNILKEGEPFRHPVTREVLGKAESVSGKAEIREVRAGLITGIVIDGTARAGDRLRLSETKVKTVFVQGGKVDWSIADDLYRRLKASGRIDMLDTALETEDADKAVGEARRLGAEVALLLTVKEADKGMLLKEQLFWVYDGSKFFEAEVKIDAALTKELKFGEQFFAPLSGEAIFRYELPFNATLLTTGDFDGDGKQEIAVSTGKDVRTYLPAVDLLPLWELKGSVFGRHVWIDAVDLNNNGRDELVVTIMGAGSGLPDKGASDSMLSQAQSGDIVSVIYELSGSEFKKLWQTNYFLRKSGTGLIGQQYLNSEGFTGEVFRIIWDGEYKRGEKAGLPKGVNIYDFTLIEGQANERFVLSYDEKGFLNVFDDKGIRIWRSAAGVGGFLNTFKKQAVASYLEGGEWSIKDRLLSRNKETLVVHRVPLAEMVRGMGFKSSLVKSFWWNGFSMEERTLIDDIPGAAVDYALAGDKMLILASPFLGLKFENILKGDSPFGSTLYIYSVRGR